MAGGSYAIINIVTIVGALASYVPLTNLSLKVGRKKVALVSSVVMVSCPLVLWLVPGFSPVPYLVFLLMGVSLGGVDMCVYTIILECCSLNSVGRYSGYYYTVSMAAQVITRSSPAWSWTSTLPCSLPTSRAWACSWASPRPVPSTATPSSLTRSSAARWPEAE